MECHAGATEPAFQPAAAGQAEAPVVEPDFGPDGVDAVPAGGAGIGVLEIAEMAAPRAAESSPEPELKPEPESDPEPEPGVESERDSGGKSEPDVGTESGLDPTVESSEQEQESELSPVSEAQPETDQNQDPEPEPEAQAESEPGVEQGSESEPKLESQPLTKRKSKPELEPIRIPDQEPELELARRLESKPESNPEPGKLLDPTVKRRKRRSAMDGAEECDGSPERVVDPRVTLLGEDDAAGPECGGCCIEVPVGRGLDGAEVASGETANSAADALSEELCETREVSLDSLTGRSRPRLGSPVMDLVDIPEGVALKSEADWEASAREGEANGLSASLGDGSGEVSTETVPVKLAISPGEVDHAQSAEDLSEVALNDFTSGAQSKTPVTSGAKTLDEPIESSLRNSIDEHSSANLSASPTEDPSSLPGSDSPAEPASDPPSSGSSPPRDPDPMPCAQLAKSASLPPGEAPPDPALRRRRVSFPNSDVSLVTGYIEPRNPLGAMYNASPEVISAAYRQSCLKHGSKPLPAVLRQIAALPVIGDRVESLSLRGLRLDRAQCESLEEILKKIQFNLVDVSGCGLDDDSAAAVFEMVEFYDSALAVSFGGNKLGVRGWQACCRMIKASVSLEQISAEGVELYDSSAAALGRSLRLSANLRVLHLEGCRLHGRPMALLIAGLKQSPTLKELYLGENELGTGDGSMLGNMLKLNLRLDLVDLRINNFDNDSVSFLLKALEQQPCAAKGEGLASLNLWGNRFTLNAASCLSSLLGRHSALETLNLGRNAIGNQTLRFLKVSLMANTALRRLGLQECKLDCEGAVALAEILAGNAGLQRVDLRGNKVGVGGLLALARALEHNTRLVQLDLDPAGDDAERLMLLARIRDLCETNRQRVLPDEEAPRSDTILRRLSAAFRRVSLTCDAPAAATAAAAAAAASAAPPPPPEPEPAEERRRLVSPSPSPSSSPLPSPSRSRFKVFKVPPPAPAGSPPVSPGVLQRPPRGGTQSDPASPNPSPVRAFRGFRVTAVAEPTRPRSLQ